MNSTSEKYKSIFNRDFYPTPHDVLSSMQIDCNGLKVLEPSAGKGNIIDWLKEHGAKEVTFCEINDDLMNICKSKARFLKPNFLKVTAEEVSHIQLIVMNPPFSEAKRHILHAWEIAPDGCTIISLCNSDTLEHWNGNDESSIKYITKNHGYSFDLGPCFDTAERKTNVKISCIHLFKPCDNHSTNFEGFYMDSEEYKLGEDAIMRYDEIQSLVNSYMSALQCFDKFREVNTEMINICSIVRMNEGFSYNLSYGKSTATKSEFAKELQSRLWKHIFNKMNMNKYLTTGVMQDINRFIENQSNVPFTRRNIFKLIEIIIGTKEQSFKRALVEAIDNFTKHTHENRYGVEGWKTNSGHLLNHKFIVDWMCEVSEFGSSKGRIKMRYSHNNNLINDLTKVICNLTGTDYNSINTVHDILDRFNGFIPGKWYSCGFFEVKGFKKGTMHFKFTNLKLWEQLNREYAKIKGQVLPEKI